MRIAEKWIVRAAPRKPKCVTAACGLIGARSAESAVDLMEASSFRSFAAVNGALHAPPPAAKAIDSRKTSEAHASMRATARRVAARGAAAPVESQGRHRATKLCNS